MNSNSENKEVHVRSWKSITLDSYINSRYYLDAIHVSNGLHYVYAFWIIYYFLLFIYVFEIILLKFNVIKLLLFFRLSSEMIMTLQPFFQNIHTFISPIVYWLNIFVVGKNVYHSISLKSSKTSEWRQ